jgi:hypothetical protein
VRHRATAAELVEQTAGTRALTELHRRLLVFEELHACAAGLRERLEERLRPVQVVEGDVAGTAGGQRDQDLADPVGVRRAAGDVDDRQAGLGLPVGAEEAAALALVELQAGRVTRVGLHRGDAAPAGAVADRDHDAGGLAQLGDPVDHRPVGEHVHRARAVGPLDDGALQDEDVEGALATDAVGEDLLGLVAQLHAERGMPQQLKPEVDDQVDHVGLLGIEERHRVARTRAGLEPQHR